MTEKNEPNGKVDRHRAAILLWICVLVIMAMAYFGYQVGSDFAHRDNARDEAAREAELVGEVVK